MSSLKRLVLSCEGQEPWLTDEGIAAVTQLPTLAVLVLAGQENVTDVSLSYLSHVASLR